MASASTTGSTRRSSSSAPTGSAPGRVDSPPTSKIAAPSLTSSTPCAIAASASRYLPPSENESGVTLTTPISLGFMSRSIPSLLPGGVDLGDCPEEAAQPPPQRVVVPNRRQDPPARKPWSLDPQPASPPAYPGRGRGIGREPSRCARSGSGAGSAGCAGSSSS